MSLRGGGRVGGPTVIQRGGFGKSGNKARYLKAAAADPEAQKTLSERNNRKVSREKDDQISNSVAAVMTREFPIRYGRAEELLKIIQDSGSIVMVDGDTITLPEDISPLDLMTGGKFLMIWNLKSSRWKIPWGDDATDDPIRFNNIKLRVETMADKARDEKRGKVPSLDHVKAVMGLIPSIYQPAQRTTTERKKSANKPMVPLGKGGSYITLPEKRD